jgi:HlyD family secretion protein
MSLAQPSSVLRRRDLLRRLVAAVALLAIVAAAGWIVWPRLSRSTTAAGPILHTVARADFIHNIVEQGTTESAANVEIRCEVKSNNNSRSTILEVVPEGKLVEKGELLVRFDSATLDSDRIKQQMAVALSKSELIKAETALEVAMQAWEEYLGEDCPKRKEMNEMFSARLAKAKDAVPKEILEKEATAKAAPGKGLQSKDRVRKEGTFLQQQKAAQSEVFVASESLRRAEEYAAFSEKLFKKGYVTKPQWEADLFAVDKAKKDLEVAQIKSKVLEGYTRKKTITQLDSDIETAKAKLEAQLNSDDLECKKLAQIEDQIKKCEIRSPCAGQVVYVNFINRWEPQRSVMIEPGAQIWERQSIIRLPDHEQMQVKARVNESKISMVAPGMSATIKLDALPDAELEGTVVKIEESPLPSSASGVKEYETTVRVHKSPPGMKVGLTAEVTIHVERSPGQLQVPVHAVLEHGDRHFCVFYKDGQFEAREVKIGSANEKFVVIREGLAENEQLVANPAAHRDKLTLPDLPRAERTPVMLANAAAPTAAKPSIAEKKADGAQPAVNPDNAERLFAEYDKQGDGRVKLAELPDSVRSWFDKADVNSDGFIDRGELKAAVDRMAARPPSGGGKAVGAGPGGGGRGRSGTSAGLASGPAGSRPESRPTAGASP